MLLSEIVVKPRTGFNPYPKNHGRYDVNKNCSVQYVKQDNEQLPKDDQVGKWELKDEDRADTKFPVVNGKFKDVVTKAIKAHKLSTGSSFSNSLRIKEVK
jgi:hypothetical protein